MSFRRTPVCFPRPWTSDTLGRSRFPSAGEGTRICMSASASPVSALPNIPQYRNFFTIITSRTKLGRHPNRPRFIRIPNHRSPEPGPLHPAGVPGPRPAYRRTPDGVRVTPEPLSVATIGPNTIAGPRARGEWRSASAARAEALRRCVDCRVGQVVEPAAPPSQSWVRFLKGGIGVPSGASTMLRCAPARALAHVCWALNGEGMAGRYAWSRGEATPKVGGLRSEGLARWRRGWRLGLSGKGAPDEKGDAPAQQPVDIQLKPRNDYYPSNELKNSREGALSLSQLLPEEEKPPTARTSRLG